MPVQDFQNMWLCWRGVYGRTTSHISTFQMQMSRTKTFYLDFHIQQSSNGP